MYVPAAAIVTPVDVAAVKTPVPELGRRVSVLAIPVLKVAVIALEAAKPAPAKTRNALVAPKATGISLVVEEVNVLPTNVPATTVMEGITVNVAVATFVVRAFAPS
jgi:hypothetical protein